MNKISSFKEAGFDVLAHSVIDESPDTSFIGEYTDKLEAGVIVCRGEHSGLYFEDLPEDAETPLRGNEFRGFKPYAGGEKVGTRNYKKYGEQDFKRMEGLNNNDWCFLGVIVDVYRKGIKLASASLWGIESDSGEDYINETVKVLTSEAIDEARRNIAELCKSEEVLK